MWTNLINQMECVGVTVNDIAELLGYTPKTIAIRLCGLSEFRARELEKIRTAYGFDLVTDLMRMYHKRQITVKG